MKILIIYASNSGGTYLAGEIIKQVLAKRHLVAIKKASEALPRELEQFDLVILGSPSWLVAGLQGQPHESMLDFMRQVEAQNLPKKLFAIFGCGDNSYAEFCGAVDKLEQFVNSLHAILIKPSLRIDGYFFTLTENEKIVSTWATRLNQKLLAKK